MFLSNGMPIFPIIMMLIMLVLMALFIFKCYRAKGFKCCSKQVNNSAIDILKEMPGAKLVKANLKKLS